MQAGTLRLLLQHGADLGLELGNGRTIAVEAAARGHADVLRLLLAPKDAGAGDAPTGEKSERVGARNANAGGGGAGVSTTVQNGYGRTLLMEAARNGHVGCVRVGVAAGADVNFATKNSNVTAAMFAAMEGHAECFTALRDAGADLNVARNLDGKTAMQMHRERVAAEMAKFKAA
jgi:ankyrin repeat protein